MKIQPRGWQLRFIAKYVANSTPDFLCVACPGAGKTYAAGFVARDLLDDGTVERLLIVVPTASLREQWMNSLARLGIVVDGITANNKLGERPFTDGQPTRGWVITYASLLAGENDHRKLNAARKTMVILDEIHHLGENASWGKAAVNALSPCVRRLALSGTPFKGNKDRIPFVEYDDEGRCRYRDDLDGTPYPQGFDYSYGVALGEKDPPVRPSVFQMYDGDIAWLEQWTDEERQVRLSDALAKADRSKANRHALDPRGDWLRSVLSGANERLDAVRAEGDPTAKGLVVCMDTKHADAVVTLIEKICGPGSVKVAVSKDRDGRDVSEEARDTIAKFGASSARWLVAVAMVSEGVDIPQLRVGVYASVARSDLLFRQILGRFVRRTNLPIEVDQTAYLFVPKDPRTVEMADGVYDEIRCALLEKDLDDDEPSPAPILDGEGVEAQPMLPFDSFRRAEAQDPSLLVPRQGSVPMDQVAAVARNTNQPIAIVTQILAAATDAGLIPAQRQPVPEAAEPPPPPGVGYKERLSRAKQELEQTIRQLTAAFMRRHKIAYTPAAYQAQIAYIKTEVYSGAGIAKGDFDRADIPQLIEAHRRARKMWADLG